MILKLSHQLVLDGQRGFLQDLCCLALQWGVEFPEYESSIVRMIMVFYIGCYLPTLFRCFSFVRIWLDLVICNSVSVLNSICFSAPAQDFIM